MMMMMVLYCAGDTRSRSIAAAAAATHFSADDALRSPKQALYRFL